MSDFDYVAAPGTALRKTPRVRRAQFGDGYLQRIADGINSQPAIWDVILNVTEDAADTIEALFEGYAGVESFTWTPPGNKPEITVICSEWRRTYASYRAGVSITCTFEEQFDIGTRPSAALDAGAISVASFTDSTITLQSDIDAHGGTAPRTIQWQRRPAGSPTVWTNVGTGLFTLADTGLADETTYFYRRRVTDVVAAVEYTAEVSATTAITALTGGTIAALTNGSTTASFTSSVAPSGGSGTLRYQWQRRTGGSPIVWANIAGETSATLSDTGLTASTQYYWRRQVSDSQSPSIYAYSNEIVLTTSAGGTTLTDTFNRTASAVTINNPSDFGSTAVPWVARSGTPGIYTGGAAAYFAGAADDNMATRDCGSSNARVTMTLATGSVAAGFVFGVVLRWSALGRVIAIGSVGGSGSWSIYEYNAGYNLLATTSIVSADGDIFEFSIDGSNDIRSYYNSSIISALNCNSARGAGSTHFGLRQSGTLAFGGWDSFLITPNVT